MDILIYGQTDVGKTHLASTLPNTIIIDFDNLSHKAGVMEDEVFVIPKMVDGKQLTAVQRFAYYERFMDNLKLAKEGKEVAPEFAHLKYDMVNCSNIVLDTMTSLEELILEYTREVNPKVFTEMTKYMTDHKFNVSVGIGQHISKMVKDIKDLGLSVIATAHTKSADNVNEVTALVHFEFKKVLESTFELIGYMYKEEDKRMITFESSTVFTKGKGTFTDISSLQEVIAHYKKEIKANNQILDGAKAVKALSQEIKDIKGLNELVDAISKLPVSTQIACKKYIYEAIHKLKIQVKLEDGKYVQV